LCIANDSASTCPIGRRENGLIVENRDYWNVAGFLAQVCLMALPGSYTATP